MTAARESEEQDVENTTDGSNLMDFYRKEVWWLFQFPMPIDRQENYYEKSLSRLRRVTFVNCTIVPRVVSRDKFFFPTIIIASSSDLCSFAVITG